MGEAFMNFPLHVHITYILYPPPFEIHVPYPSLLGILAYFVGEGGVVLEILIMGEVLWTISSNYTHFGINGLLGHTGKTILAVAMKEPAAVILIHNIMMTHNSITSLASSPGSPIFSTLYEKRGRAW